MRRMQGLSLLELTLVLTVAALILSAGVHYYTVTRRASLMLAATQQIGRVVDASYRWLQGQRQSNMTSIGITKLVTGDYLDVRDETNPWGGAVSVSAADSGSGLTIELQNLAESTCVALKQRFLDSTQVNNTRCQGKNEDVIWQGDF